MVPWLIVSLLTVNYISLYSPKPIEFNIALEDGSIVTGSVEGSISYDKDRVILDKGVELYYRDIVLKAEKIILNKENSEVFVEGNVIVDQGPYRMVAARGVVNLKEKTAKLISARAELEGEYYFSGHEVEKLGEEYYSFSKGEFTSCQGEVPSWSFHARKANVDLGGYARARDVVMKVRGIPVGYIPYLIWPAKQERSSGFLVPKLGNSSDKGYRLGLAYYWAISRSYDATFFVDLYSENFLASGLEYRYTPSANTSGQFIAYYVKEPYGTSRWKYLLNHETTLKNAKVVLYLEDYSDFFFFRDFERELRKRSRSSVYSVGYYEFNKDVYNFKIQVDNRKTFLYGDKPLVLSQVPEVEFSIISKDVDWLNGYFSLFTGLHRLEVDRPGSYAGSFNRLYLSPNLRFPWAPAPWLSLNLDLGTHVTLWDSAVVSVEGERKLQKQSVKRQLNFVKLNVIGPLFSKIFVREDKKFKHIIEPRLEYQFVSDFENSDIVPVFDEVDTIRSKNSVAFSIVNRFLFKKGNRSGKEVGSFTLSRFLSLDRDKYLEIVGDKKSHLSPLYASVRIIPSNRFRLRGDVTYSLLGSRISSIRLTLATNINNLSLSGSWLPRYSTLDGTVLSNHANLTFAYSGKNFSLRSSINYDIKNSQFRNQRYLIALKGSCYTINLEMYETFTSVGKRRDWILGVDLKNIGSFIDLSGGW